MQSANYIQEGLCNAMEVPYLTGMRALPSVSQQFTEFQQHDILHIKSFLITTLEIKEADGLASLLPNRRHLLYRAHQ